MLNDKNYRRVMKYIKRGDNNKWVAALAAKRVSGTQTSALANDLACSVDTIERLRYAGWCYVELRRFSRTGAEVELLHEVRNSLSVMHFSKLGQAWARFEFSPKEAFDYLLTAHQERGSYRQMIAAIEGEHKGVQDKEVTCSRYQKSQCPYQSLLEEKITHNLQSSKETNLPPQVLVGG